MEMTGMERLTQTKLRTEMLRTGLWKNQICTERAHRKTQSHEIKGLLLRSCRTLMKKGFHR